MFKATVITPNRVLFEGDVRSVFFPGATGEFEILEFHKPLLSLLRKGDILIDDARTIPIKRGVVQVFENELVAVVEE